MSYLTVFSFYINIFFYLFLLYMYIIFYFNLLLLNIILYFNLLLLNIILYFNLILLNIILNFNLFLLDIFTFRYWRPGPRATPVSDTKYITYGFAYLQDMIDHAIIKLQTNNTSDIGVFTQMFPYPCYIKDK
jgi:hypothetical protein